MVWRWKSSNGKIRVMESDCPQQICVKQGWIKSPNDMIVCVPNRTIIYLKSDKKENKLDYISE